jgi:hypothetical protein
MRPAALLQIAAQIAALAVPAASGAWAQEPDWAQLAAVREVLVVTTDADGAHRATTVWLAVLDGRGYVRTGRTRWGANVERDPDLVLSAGGKEYPLRAERVTEEALLGRVQAAFRAKYGTTDRMLAVLRPLMGSARVYRLVARPQAP